MLHSQMSALGLIFRILKESYAAFSVARIIYKIVVITVMFLPRIGKYLLLSPTAVEHSEGFCMKLNLLRVKNTYLGLFSYHRVEHTFCTY